MSNYKTLAIEVRDSVVWCKLNRPGVRNAFNPEMIRELTDCTSEINSGTRAFVLQGEGPVFCAGGDLNWMKESLELSKAENLEDAKRLAGMLAGLDGIPVPVIGIIHGAAMGGGIGLVSICDYSVAVEGTQFSFSEMKLGIVPACIAPFVIRKIGPGHTRALFATADKFSAKRAFEIGLVHQVVADLEEAYRLVEQKLQQILECGPQALGLAKKLIGDLLWSVNAEAQLSLAAELLASVRVSEEGQEGIRAFLEKRKPGWK
jgi:methylglutaconyl-CoA hydratase